MATHGESSELVFLDGSRVSTGPVFARELLKVLEACGLPCAIRVLPDHSSVESLSSEPGERGLLDSLFLAWKLHPARILVLASKKAVLNNS